MATFGLNRKALSDTQPMLHSMFALSAAKLRFDTVGLLFDKCYADKPETIDTLKDNIREAIDEIQLHLIDNCLEIGPIV